MDDLVKTTKQTNFYTFIFNKIMEHLQKNSEYVLLEKERVMEKMD